MGALLWSLLLLLQEGEWLPAPVYDCLYTPLFYLALGLQKTLPLGMNVSALLSMGTKG